MNQQTQGGVIQSCKQKKMFEKHTESTFAAMKDILTQKYGEDYWKTDVRTRKHKKKRQRKRKSR